MPDATDPTDVPASPAVTDAYDAVRYPPIVHSQTHPERLFVNATLFGLEPAPVGSCRVLELGCGAGDNLIAVAFAHPESQCVGIDTSAAAIADGQALAAEVGLDNVTLMETDVMAITPDFGEFDYIIAHGLYSWVPPEVREKILEICRANLAPQGVAYISYSVYPGAHFRQMSRGLMTFHGRQWEEPVDKVKQGRALLQFLSDAKPLYRQDAGAGGERPMESYALRRNELYRQLLKNEFDHLNRTPIPITYHDDFSTVNTPVYFHEFAAHAGRHGMQYLCEASFPDTEPPVPGAPPSMPPDVAKMLDQVSPEDVVSREQYADFIKCRQFRQTLLCRGDIVISRPAAARRVEGLYVSCPARPVNANPDLRSSAPESFEIPNRGTFAINQPLGKVALTELGRVWPGRVSFDDLVERCRARAVEAGGGVDPMGDSEVYKRVLADLMLGGYAANLLTLHAHMPAVATTPGERPAASRLARAQAARRTQVSNLAGATVDLTGPVGARLLRLLDGTRDRDALAVDLAAVCLRDGHTRARNGVPIIDPADMAAILRAEMDAHLAEMARLSLLEE